MEWNRNNTTIITPNGDFRATEVRKDSVAMDLLKKNDEAGRTKQQLDELSDDELKTMALPIFGAYEMVRIKDARNSITPDVVKQNDILFWYFVEHNDRNLDAAALRELSDNKFQELIDNAVRDLPDSSNMPMPSMDDQDRGQQPFRFSKWLYAAPVVALVVILLTSWIYLNWFYLTSINNEQSEPADTATFVIPDGKDGIIISSSDTIKSVTDIAPVIISLQHLEKKVGEVEKIANENAASINEARNDITDNAREIAGLVADVSANKQRVEEVAANVQRLSAQLSRNLTETESRLTQKVGAAYDWAESMGYRIIVIGDFNPDNKKDPALYDDLSQAMREQVAAVGLILKEGQYTVETIRGYADPRPIASTEAKKLYGNNFGLAYARAQAVGDYLNYVLKGRIKTKEVVRAGTDNDRFGGTNRYNRCAIIVLHQIKKQ